MSFKNIETPDYKVVKTIDEQLKEISRKLKKEIDFIDSLCAPYLKFELKEGLILFYSFIFC